MTQDFSDDNLTAVRARAIIPLANERPARGWDALTAPLEVIEDGVIAAENGRIIAIEPYATYRRRQDSLAPQHIRDLGDVVLAPGLVNCHTHLELSWMRGKIEPGLGFPDWLARLVALDHENDGGESLPTLEDAVRGMRDTGTALAGDITSRMPETVFQTGERLGLTLRPFVEIIGHGASAPGEAAKTAAHAGFSLAGHALYSTPGEAFVKAKTWCDTRALPFSMHLAEHEDETECLFGRGRFYERLRQSILPAAWKAPNMRPVPYAASLGLLRNGTIAVHCVTCAGDDIETLCRSDAAVCLCPRSNEFIGTGAAPAVSFAKNGAFLVLGTDSLASNRDLSLWKEAEYFLQKNLLPANALLRMATVNGAAALGFPQGFCGLERGGRFCYTVFPSDTLTLFAGKSGGDA